MYQNYPLALSSFIAPQQGVVVPITSNNVISLEKNA